ncbi:hypothetical protein SAMN02799630_04946 [Paenibacillus sp. UNCCL117]|uniref:hypothetical protein n=1 Tax=unclassified Paenibacillus TaxID=185978 RepID=UPI00089134E0|nr:MULTISPECIES: hypothetical protein [unclassified Paenibacillus]SDE19635.1 hypothetical protein SAMN04488602_12142 [Paenibacillus sp. cl123]SFW61967.1 hypothetical protein SAMN02799630_04946 [Paenibacillus sp. UNCCL117]
MEQATKLPRQTDAGPKKAGRSFYHYRQRLTQLIDLAPTRMIEHMAQLMREHDAPAEQYERLGLTGGAG